MIGGLLRFGPGAMFLLCPYPPFSMATVTSSCTTERYLCRKLCTLSWPLRPSSCENFGSENKIFYPNTVISRKSNCLRASGKPVRRNRGQNPCKTRPSSYPCTSLRFTLARVFWVSGHHRPSSSVVVL